MASELLVVDDNSADFRFLGSEWRTSSLVQWYGGTSRYPVAEQGSPTPSASFSLTFEGNSIAFYGQTPAPPASQSVSITIDGGEPYMSNYADPSPPSYRQWYQSPELTDGRHNITISLIEGASVDYAVVGAGPNTPIGEKQIIVDDDSPQIDYNGAWARNIGDFDAGTLTDGSPFHNGTHHAWSTGDGFTFKFTGTSLAVYGIFSWSTLGLLSVTYSLDGTYLSETYSVTTSSPEYVNNIGDVSNFLYYNSNSISAGEHTLVMNVTHCVNQSFIIDYITYSPSFSRIPPISTTATVSVTKPSGTPAGRTSNPLTSASGKPESEKATPVEAIIGGTIGGLVFLILIGVLLSYIRRRQLKKKTRQRLGSHDYVDPSKPLMRQKLAPIQNEFAHRMMTSRSPGTITPFREVYPQPRSAIPNSAVPISNRSNPPSGFEGPQRSRQLGRPVLPPITTQLSPRGVHEVRSGSSARPRTSFETVNSRAERLLTPVRRQDTVLNASPSPYQIIGVAESFPSSSATSNRLRPSLSFEGQYCNTRTPVPAPNQRRANPTPSIARDSHRSRNRSTNDGRFATCSTQHEGPGSIPVRRGYSDSPFLSGHGTQYTYSPLCSSRFESNPEIQLRHNTPGPQDQDQPLHPRTPARPAPINIDLPIRVDLDETVTIRGRREERCVDTASSSVPQTVTRLTPVRPTFTEVQPSPTTQLVRTPTSPFSTLLPRLTSMLRRGASRASPTDVPDDIYDYDSDTAPPAYHTLSTRQSISAASPNVRLLPATPGPSSLPLG